MCQTLTLQAQHGNHSTGPTHLRAIFTPLSISTASDCPHKPPPRHPAWAAKRNGPSSAEPGPKLREKCRTGGMKPARFCCGYAIRRQRLNSALRSLKVQFCTFLPERIPSYRVMYLGGPIARKGNAMSGKRINLRKESIMAGLYLGIAVTGLNALVAMGLVIAFM